jgi:hypothetical protein
MATTRGLEETPYFGSTLLERPDEEQLASTRHADATAIARHAPKAGADPLICIRPKYPSAGRDFRVPGSRLSRCQPQGLHQRSNIPQREHGGNGESGRVAKVGKPILCAAKVCDFPSDSGIDRLVLAWLGLARSFFGVVATTAPREDGGHRCIEKALAGRFTPRLFLNFQPSND